MVKRAMGFMRAYDRIGTKLERFCFSRLHFITAVPIIIRVCM